MPHPIRLTDSQLDAVLAAARPLRVADRDAFLQDVAAALQGRSEIGDGDVTARSLKSSAAIMIRRSCIIFPSTGARRDSLARALFPGVHPA
jgi:hypothetical protein